jgi:FAD/FMN-containing dehydrogenase
MSEITINRNDGTRTGIDESALAALQSKLKGKLLTSGASGYDEARTVWNAMIDRRPALIAQCANAEDICQAVTFAASKKLMLAVRGGGHNIAGNSVCDGGMMIDLTLMNSVQVDVQNRTARVGPGANLGVIDQATQAHGLATPLGINSTTGISGLTLGGGFGWLSRRYGLTIDNLISAEVIGADGTKRTASATENPDLFWAIRGGGGNFGVVSSFTFRLHEVGPEVLSGLIVHPFEQAGELLRFYRDFVPSLPKEAAVWVVMRDAPPLPFLPEEWHGKKVLVFAACSSGDFAQTEKALAPLRSFGKPIADVIGPHPYVGFQTAFDPLLAPGYRNYWKTHNFTELTDGLFDVFVKQINAMPGHDSEIFFGQLGGAINEVPVNATAYSARNIEYVMNVHSRWNSPADDEKGIQWARDIFAQAKPYAVQGGYVNFMTEDEGDRIESVYGPNYQRLRELKKKYDPSNLFRMNQNIKP